MAEVKEYYKAAEEKMEGTILHLDDSLARIRAGKANVRILDSVRIDYYGGLVPLSNVATITTPDARTISIQPWEKKLITDIEKAIMNSEVGITPENNGDVIRFMIPALTEERDRKSTRLHSTHIQKLRIPSSV